MLEKFMHKVKDAVVNISKKDKKRVLDAAKALDGEIINFVDNVHFFMDQEKLTEEQRVLFCSELKKFHLQGKTTLKLDIGIGEIGNYQQYTVITKQD